MFDPDIMHLDLFNTGVISASISISGHLVYRAGA